MSCTSCRMPRHRTSESSLRTKGRRRLNATRHPGATAKIACQCNRSLSADSSTATGRPSESSPTDASEARSPLRTHSARRLTAQSMRRGAPGASDFKSSAIEASASSRCNDREVKRVDTTWAEHLPKSRIGSCRHNLPCMIPRTNAPPTLHRKPSEHFKRLRCLRLEDPLYHTYAMQHLLEEGQGREGVHRPRDATKQVCNSLGELRQPGRPSRHRPSGWGARGA